MTDEDRAPGESGGAAAPAAPRDAPVEPTAAWVPPGTAGAPELPKPPSGVRGMALALALLGLGALLLGQVEVALYLVMATLYLVAQATDMHPSLGRLYALLRWIPATSGALLLGVVAATTVGGDAGSLVHPGGGEVVARLAVAAFAGLGVVACLALLVPAAADALTRRLFRGASPDHTLRLTATIVLVTLWAGPSLCFVARDVLAGFLKDPRELVGTETLAGGLVGYVVLAFAAVGFRVRRAGRESLARLGLARLRAADGLLVVGGVVALWLLNAGSESFERAVLPGLWAHDNAFTEALAGVMAPGQVLLLGLSAGVGEEITLRGALQPKLGIVLTSLLFAALHVQYSWFGMLSLLVFGLLLGLIRQRSSTTVAIVVHALYDVLAVVTAKP